MITKAVSGVYAAMVTPRTSEGIIEVVALTRLVQFLFARDISSFALNGATGEYCLTTPAQLHLLLATVQEAAEGRANILCGVGAPSTALAVEFAAIAQQHGAHGLLLPMPFFFPYQQQDLDVFCRTVAGATDLPILLYNLPQFTTGIEKETALQLIADVPNIIGIKDSSGSLEILRHLDANGINACRIVGNDGVLAQALLEGACDGVVSGVACALPELITALYAAVPAPAPSLFHAYSSLLDEFIDQLNAFPTPWGLKFALDARDVLSASFAQPVTPGRHAQALVMAEWLRAWLPAAIPTVAQIH